MSNRHYLCQFQIHNFTYVYRCRVDDQYCCGYTCCFKPIAVDQHSSLVTSWYFWSLISLVVVVFGCIILSFTLSSLKRKSNTQRVTSAWIGLMSGGGNLNNLATTVVGQSGIIQPNIQYKREDKKKAGRAVLQAKTKQPVVCDQKPKTETPTIITPDEKPSNNWVDLQLKPLSAAYKSAWNGDPIEMRLANGQNILPPGFINT